MVGDLLGMPAYLRGSSLPGCPGRPGVRSWALGHTEQWPQGQGRLICGDIPLPDMVSKLESQSSNVYGILAA